MDLRLKNATPVSTVLLSRCQRIVVIWEASKHTPGALICQPIDIASEMGNGATRCRFGVYCCLNRYDPQLDKRLLDPKDL